MNIIHISVAPCSITQHHAAPRSTFYVFGVHSLSLHLFSLLHSYFLGLVTCFSIFLFLFYVLYLLRKYILYYFCFLVCFSKYYKGITVYRGTSWSETSLFVLRLSWCFVSFHSSPALLQVLYPPFPSATLPITSLSRISFQSFAYLIWCSLKSECPNVLS